MWYGRLTCIKVRYCHSCQDVAASSSNLIAKLSHDGPFAMTSHSSAIGHDNVHVALPE